MRVGWGLLAALCAFALLPCQALAAPTWLAPMDLSASGANADNPQVGLDGEGGAQALWALDGGIQVSDHPVGGTFSAPDDLVPSSRLATGQQMAVNARGDAIALFTEYNGANDIVHVSYRRAGGDWEVPVPVSAVGQSASFLRVAIAPNGDAIASWYRSPTMQIAFRPAATGEWELPLNVQSGDAVALAFDASSNALAVWPEPTIQRLVSAFRPAGAPGWSAAQNISEPDPSIYVPVVTFDPNGNALTAFLRGGVLQAAERSPGAGGSWRSLGDISLPGESPNTLGGPDVAMAADGQAVIAWSAIPPMSISVYRIRASYRPAGGDFQQPMDLTPTPTGNTPAFAPRVSMDAQGNAIAAWVHADGPVQSGGKYIAQAGVKPSGTSAWGQTKDLSEAGQSADAVELAVDPHGNAIAVWERSNGTNPIAQYAAYDGAGPLLRSLSVPSSGAPGVPLSFAVAPVDAWSAVVSTSWGFGDGSSANGTTATHAYPAPGTYEVTVTSVDALNNATTAKRSVVIAAPPPPPTAAGAPRISRATMKAKRFRVAKKATPVSAAVPKGSAFRFTLSAAAKVTISITGTGPGLRSGRRCVKPSAKLRRAGAKRCKRKLRGGKLTRKSLKAGRNSVAFSGRIGRRALEPGSYRALLRASNAGGSSKAVSLRFTIIR